MMGYYFSSLDNVDFGKVYRIKFDDDVYNKGGQPGLFHS